MKDSQTPSTPRKPASLLGKLSVVIVAVLLRFCGSALHSSDRSPPRIVVPPVMTLAAGAPLTAEQQNATASAKALLNHEGLSRDGLVKRLVRDGYDVNDAAIAVDNMNAMDAGVNWSHEAALAASGYQDRFRRIGLSRATIITFLESDGFTREQAALGVDFLHLNWNGNAARAAKRALTYHFEQEDPTCDELVTYLTADNEIGGFTPEQARYAGEAVGKC